MARPGSSLHFQITLLLMVIGLLGASAWFTYNAVHVTNQNTALLFKNASATNE